MAGVSALPASQKTVCEEICGFLQDMKLRIESICERDRRRLLSDGTSPSLYDFGAGRIFSHPGKTSISDSREMTNELANFMEVMRKTIETWSDHYRILIMGNERASRIENANGKLDVVQYPNKSCAVAERTLDLHSSKAAEPSSEMLSILSPSNTTSQGITQELTHNITHANHHSQLDLETAFAVTPRQSGQSKPICEDDDCDTSSHDREDVPILQTHTKVAPTAPSTKRRKSKEEVVSPVNCQDLTIRRLQYKVEVVESPPWLPEGWITELKTRSAGGSAGCKDKYYYDTVTKRRCRSQKEVFSLIETGKLGRYKRRTKLEPHRNISGTETATAANDINENPVKNNVEVTSKQEMPIIKSNTSVPVRRTTPGKNLPASLAISPPPPGQHGIVSNNMFLPYQPGQPSEWMMCESLTNVHTVPHPTMLDHFRLSDSMSNRGKGPIMPNSERGPYMVDGERGTFLPNSERGSVMPNGERSHHVATWPRPRYCDSSDSAAARPFIERFEVGRGTHSEGSNSMLVGGHVSVGRESYSSMEAAPKRSRKPSKRVATAF